MATFNFFENDVLEASIDVVSVLPGEEGNGLLLAIIETAGVGSTPAVTGDFANGYTISVDDTLPAAYATLVSTLEFIPEISASLRTPVGAALYEASIQNPPPPVELAGGTDAHVPEPGSSAVIASLLLVLGFRRVRGDFSA